MLKETVSGEAEDEQAEEQHQTHQNNMGYSLFWCLVDSTLYGHGGNRYDRSILHRLFLPFIHEMGVFFIWFLDYVQIRHFNLVSLCWPCLWKKCALYVDAYRQKVDEEEAKDGAVNAQNSGD